MATAKKPARNKPQRPPHPEDARMRAQLEQALLRGTHEHYVDAEQYDHEYSKRRDDVAFYVEVAKKSMAASRGTAPPSGRKQSQGPILELGCGSGRLTMALAKAGHTVVGVDASRQMIARCASQLERKGLTDRVSLHVADFRELAGRSVLGRQKFSLVLCPFNAFQHLYERSDVEAFLDGVRAHLAPGGRFVFDLMNPD
ncbi:MAG: class I SAM-dependent methyltransferase, partial [Polyangia bacterium]